MSANGINNLVSVCQTTESATHDYWYLHTRQFKLSTRYRKLSNVINLYWKRTTYACLVLITYLHTDHWVSHVYHVLITYLNTGHSRRSVRLRKLQTNSVVQLMFNVMQWYICTATLYRNSPCSVQIWSVLNYITKLNTRYSTLKQF